MEEAKIKEESQSVASHPGRKRRFSKQKKQAIVEETYQVGALYRCPIDVIPKA